MIFPFLLFSQTYSIDDKELLMSGISSDNDISANTYYNTIDSCNISWAIITDSVPSQWELSFCFPYCYIIGVTNGQDDFLPNEQLYLNCHVYPNGQVGNGVIQMEITTNNIYKDTITWNATINSTVYLDEFNPLGNQQLEYIYDVFGRKVSLKTNVPLFYKYENGTVEKRLIIE